MMVSKTTVNILTILVIFTFFGIGYITFLQYQPNSSVPASVAESRDELDTLKVETRKMIADLRQLENINLDVGVFKGEAYLHLEDFATAIDEEPVGRDNPFDPIKVKLIDGSTRTVQTGSHADDGQDNRLLLF
ncbi:hypothetical protein AUJ44_02775 [Candidatus Nomurabacteria bacterium CG1_02_47_685]|uniref:Uncharacterized protein n=1 Tax=Candidatus Nomurabacteria bacterium CG1_02_47_685 TaxID=1805282 RepID=A0A1J4V579_9BACT|nr:MAG: hypothetical protein AUJ44_02775 [Candidatus Nomurabacteria bacterium CG1_02_47_685]